MDWMEVDNDEEPRPLKLANLTKTISFGSELK